MTAAIYLAVTIYLSIGVILVVRAALYRFRYKQFDLEGAATMIGLVFLWLPVATCEVREWRYQRRKRREWEKVRKRRGPGDNSPAAR